MWQGVRDIPRRCMLIRTIVSAGNALALLWLGSLVKKNPADEQAASQDGLILCLGWGQEISVRRM